MNGRRRRKGKVNICFGSFRMRDFFCWIKQFDWLSIEQVSEMPIPEVLKVGDFFFYLIITPCNIVNTG